MLAVNCPACQRALNLTENLRGRRVKCPACTQTFRAPHDDPEVPMVEEVVSRAPAADPANAFDFGEHTGEGLSRTRARVFTQSAAGWLQAMAVTDLVLSFAFVALMLLSTAIFPNASQVLFLIVFLFLSCVFLYAPLVFVFIGSNCLRNRRSRGLVVTGAVLALVVSLETLVGGGFMGLTALRVLMLGARAGMVAVLLLLLAAIALFATAAGVVGAVKTFIVLQRRDVQEAFR